MLGGLESEKASCDEEDLGAVWNLLPASAMVGIDWGYPARQSEVPGQTSPDEPAGMDQVTSDQAKPVTMCVQQHHNL